MEPCHKHTFKFLLVIALAITMCIPSRVYASEEIESGNTVATEETDSSESDKVILSPEGIPSDVVSAHPEAFGIVVPASIDDIKDRYNNYGSSSIIVVDNKYLSKEDFVDILNNLPYDYEGFYERNAEFIYDMQEETGIDGLFICGIIAIESGWGTCKANTNNVGGLRGSGGWMAFATEEDCIKCIFETVASYGSTTPHSIGCTYCDSNWGDSVLSAMRMIISSVD